MTEPVPWEWLLFMGGVITLAGGVGSVVVKLMNPYRKLKEEMAANKKELELHKRLLEQDNNRLKGNDAYMTAILKAIYALLEHARTNNSTGLMDTASKELQQFLIERK